MSGERCKAVSCWCFLTWWFWATWNALAPNRWRSEHWCGVTDNPAPFSVCQPLSLNETPFQYQTTTCTWFRNSFSTKEKHAHGLFELQCYNVHYICTFQMFEISSATSINSPGPTLTDSQYIYRKISLLFSNNHRDQHWSFYLALSSSFQLSYSLSTCNCRMVRK